MKIIILIVMSMLVGIPTIAITDDGQTGTVQKVKKESKAAAQEIKQGAIDTGKVFVEAGQKAKKISKTKWNEIKKGVQTAGGDLKNSYQETKETVQQKISGEKTESKVKPSIVADP